MAIQKRFCSAHPQRPAIGICVMTLKPICGECSTRYEGVNYSREGLELLRKQRASAAAVRPKGRAALAVVTWVCSPLLLYLMYLAYWMAAEALTSMLHGGS